MARSADRADRAVRRPAARKTTVAAKAAPTRKRVRPTVRVASAPEPRQDRARPAARKAHKVTARKRQSATPKRVTYHRTKRSHKASPRGLAAVAAFARSQVGDRYVYGATGPNRWDCSGLTQAAYRKIGINLPHHSGAQRAMARKISISEAVPGDLVVGPGHVGINMGNGMMVDAGNPRVGVAYRKIYAGLWIERL